MSKKILMVALCIFSINLCYSQIKTVVTNADLNPSPLFFGGGLVLGGGTGSFQIGLNPELVKSYNEYIDLGAAVNLYYSSYRSTNMDNSTLSYKSNNTQFGLGGFVRAWPIKQFFIQVQPEYNWTFSNAKNISQGTSGSASVSAPSFLAGLGYGNRNENGFSYFSIMFDLINSRQSPYSMGQATAQPILRAGFGIPIRLPKSKRS
jgi:hypothetical protein